VLARAGVRWWLHLCSVGGIFTAEVTVVSVDIFLFYDSGSVILGC
jgi:hypothetical protein